MRAAVGVVDRFKGASVLVAATGQGQHGSQNKGMDEGGAFYLLRMAAASG